MPNTRSASAVRLEFTAGALVHANIFGAAFTGDWLWVAGDEACGVDRKDGEFAVYGDLLRQD